MKKDLQELEELTKYRNKILDEIKLLKNDNNVQRYIKLNEEKEKLFDKQIKLYDKVKTEKYNTCNHILVYSEIYDDNCEQRRHFYRGCIKCGLDERVMNTNNYYMRYAHNNMYEFLKNHQLKGLESNILCDLKLAHAIYCKIINNHPDINDKTMLKYFEISLNNIRNNKVSDERKINRAKRLSLNPNFTKWK